MYDPAEIVQPHDGLVFNQDELRWTYQDAIKEKDNFPKPRYKYISLATYYNANLAHNIITRRLISGVIAFVGKTPIITRSKH